MMGSTAVAPPARDRWDSQRGVRGRRVRSHPHRCRHVHNTPRGISSKLWNSADDTNSEKRTRGGRFFCFFNFLSPTSHRKTELRVFWLCVKVEGEPERERWGRIFHVSVPSPQNHEVPTFYTWKRRRVPQDEKEEKSRETESASSNI